MDEDGPIRVSERKKHQRTIGFPSPTLVLDVDCSPLGNINYSAGFTR